MRIPVHTGQMRPAVRTGNSPPVHPRAYGADPPTTVHPVPSMGSSPCVRGGSLRSFRMLSDRRLIPVRTRQILNFPKILEATKSPIPSQIPMAGSICIIFSECIFADNTFWSKKTDKNKICPSSAICSIWEFVLLLAKMR